MVLYSEKGLQIYEKITQTKAYYPFEAEKEILEKYGDEIASISPFFLHSAPFRLRLCLVLCTGM